MAIWLIIGTLASPGTGEAAGKKQLPAAPTEGTPSKNSRYGEGTLSRELSTQATQYLASGDSFISYVSSTRVTVGGNTKSYSTVDTIAVDLYLQRWDSAQSQWVDVLYVGRFQNTNTSVVSGSKDVNAVSGYYYRTRANHWISEGGIVEQGSSTSTYIFVK